MSKFARETDTVRFLKYVQKLGNLEKFENIDEERVLLEKTVIISINMFLINARFFD